MQFAIIARENVKMQVEKDFMLDKNQMYVVFICSMTIIHL